MDAYIGSTSVTLDVNHFYFLCEVCGLLGVSRSKFLEKDVTFG